MSRVVIFGTGSFAEVATFYFTADSPHDVVAYCVDEPTSAEFNGRPVIATAEVVDAYPPGDHEMFVAVGYRGVNTARERCSIKARELGYSLVTYICSKATHWGTPVGAGSFIFEDNTIQPFTTIGAGCVLWSGNHIGHHSTIGDYCFITSHVVISGHVKIGTRSFIGVNATLRDDITIGVGNVIGAGAVIMKSTADDEAYVPRRTELFPRPAHGLM